MHVSKLSFNQVQNKFFGGLFTTAPYIGLDLGLEKLNLVQVGFKLGHPVMLAASSDYHNASYPEMLKQPDLFKGLIKKAFKSAPFKGRNVVATVPSPLIKILFLNFQCKANEVEDQAMLNALKFRVDEDLGGYVIDYLLINPQSNEQIDRVALVAMATNEDIESFLGLLNYSGLTVEALEIGPIAIKRVVSSISRTEETQKVLSINFGTQNSYLTVIWNNEILLDREIDFGMDTVTNAIAKAFDIDTKTALKVLHEYGLAEEEVATLLYDVDIEFDEDGDDSQMANVLLDILRPDFFNLTEEIKDVLVYVASETRGGAIETIFLMGSLSRISAIDQTLDRLISIPVRTIDPYSSFTDENQIISSADDLGPMSGIAVAAGLSMRGNV